MSKLRHSALALVTKHLWAQSRHPWFANLVRAATLQDDCRRTLRLPLLRFWVFYATKMIKWANFGTSLCDTKQVPSSEPFNGEILTPDEVTLYLKASKIVRLPTGSAGRYFGVKLGGTGGFVTKLNQWIDVLLAEKTQHKS